MFKNYLLITFRNLVKNRTFTIINIIGLGLAIAICTVAFFNHMFNYEFDRHNEHFDEIYRVTSFRDMEGREQEFGSVPATLGLQVKKDIPGIKETARLTRSNSPVKFGDDIFQASIAYVDTEFIDMFTFKILNGDKELLSEQGNVLISREMAGKLFGDDYAVGKRVTIVNDNNKEYSYTVAAVFENLPLNCSFRIDVLTHFDNFLAMWDSRDTDWKFNITALFVQFSDKSLVPQITQQLRNYIVVQNEARQDFKINRWILTPLDKVGDSTRTIWNAGLFPALHPAAAKAPPIMAIFILLIACFNFANTSVAIFSRRLKEIGLRKTFGAQRKQLIQQFMFETFIICSLAMLVGIAIAQWLVPAYSSLWSYMSIELTFTEYPVFWIFLVLLLGVTGFMAGVFPAMFVSSFSPVNVIKGNSGFKKSGKFSIVLLTLQFIISVMSLTMGVVFERNARFQNTVDRGYDNKKIIFMQLPGQNFASFRNELLQNPKIISVAGTQNHIEWGNGRKTIKSEQQQLEVNFLDVGPEYLATMGVRLEEGRLFDEARASADRTNGSVIINKKLANSFNWDVSSEKTFFLNDTIKYTVVGVVDDFYSNGVWSEIQPTVMRLSSTDLYYNLAVRANEEDQASIIDYMRLKWKEQGTNFIFNGRRQEELLQEEKDINGSILKINVFLAIAATILSLIGMYNLVSINIIKRTKEIGIRKIQGASIPLLMYLLSRKFIIVLLISSATGLLGGYYLTEVFMDSIWDYFVDITAGMLIFSASALALSTILTIVFKIYGSATKNPVVSLRYE
ncbi:MAG TPA: ABC transporter permease [Bacteroidales bacterium]|nr:ABC transporter permease [Bacteroidales bacterium]